MSSYKMFATDVNHEVDGIWIDYDFMRVRLARAGGANKAFARVLNRKSRPFKRALESDTIDEDISNRILREAYIETIIRDWNVKVDGEWRKGIEDPDSGEVIALNVKNLEMVLTRFPELFLDLVKQAQNYSLYKEEMEDEDVKNS